MNLKELSCGRTFDSQRKKNHHLRQKTHLIIRWGAYTLQFLFPQMSEHARMRKGTSIPKKEKEGKATRLAPSISSQSN
jgi:hypothetical protein